MSISIKRSELTETQKTLIVKKTLIPKEIPFNFWTMTKETVSLPLNFALFNILNEKQQDLFYEKEYPELTNINFSGKLRDHQISWCNKIVDTLNDHSGCIVGLYPGAGKTVIGAWCISKIKYHSVVLVHRDILISQWQKTFETHLPNAKIWVVDSKKIPKEIPDVMICMVQRVPKIPEEWISQIGNLIIDEAHTFCTMKKIPFLLRFKPRYIIAETATLERQDNSHKMIELMCSPHGINVKSNDRSGYKVYSVIINEKVEEEKQKDGTLDYNKYMKALTESSKMNNAVIEILKRFPEKKFIVLTKLVEHVQLLQKLLNENNFQTDTLAGSKKTYKDTDVLIGTISKIGTGFDQATACQDFSGVHCNALIFFHTVASDSLFHQNCGRVMRAEHETLIFWFTPKNRVASKHLNNMKEHILSTNGVIEKLIL